MPEHGGDHARSPLTELTLARLRELIREPEAVFWVFVFPVLLAGILGVAFRSRPPDALPVAVVAGPHGDVRLAALSAQAQFKPRLFDKVDARPGCGPGRAVLGVSPARSPPCTHET